MWQPSLVIGDRPDFCEGDIIECTMSVFFVSVLIDILIIVLTGKYRDKPQKRVSPPLYLSLVLPLSLSFPLPPFLSQAPAPPNGLYRY